MGRVKSARSGRVRRGEDFVGDIQYDEASADALVRAASAAADYLRAQGGERRAAVEKGTDDFDGAYARRFEDSARIEAADRPKLASVLDDLAKQVRCATAAARRERERAKDLAAWQIRQDERDRETAASSTSLYTPPPVTVFDMKPSETPVPPPTVSAAFSARGRPRTGSGTSGGKSSADPDHLRSFAKDYRALDRTTAAKQSTLLNTWHAFTGSCGWVRISSATIFGGFDRLLEENREDAAWADRVADAFARAGGDGAVSNAAIDAAAAFKIPTALQKLFDPDLSATQVAALWAKLGYSKANIGDLKALPIAVLSGIGNLEGVPYWVRDTANRKVLRTRLNEAETRLRELDSAITYDNGKTWAIASDQVKALKQIRKSAFSHPGDLRGERFLISLSKDQPPMAAVSIGNLDEAENVTWAVPGMGSQTTRMLDWTGAAQNIYDEQAIRDKREHAVISWMGYKAPPQPVLSGTVDPGVLLNGYAKPGGHKLADSIRGLSAARAEEMPMTNVFAHSYGSTAAAFGLTEKGVHVNTFATAGSAGIPNSIPNAGSIHADHMYSGQAREVSVIGHLLNLQEGDQWAAKGRYISSHDQDPTDSDFGATVFGTDGDAALHLKAVQDHEVLSHGHGYLDLNTESLTNIGLATTGRASEMTH